MKRILCLFLAAVFLMSLFPNSAFAQDSSVFELTAANPAPEETVFFPADEESVTQPTEEPEILLDDVVLPDGSVEEEEIEPESVNPEAVFVSEISIGIETEALSDDADAEYMLELASKLEAGEALVLSPGDKVQLNAVVLPENADFKELIWSVSDESVLTVSDCGLVEVLAEGTASVYASAVDASGVSAQIELNVEAPTESLTAALSEEYTVEPADEPNEEPNEELTGEPNEELTGEPNEELTEESGEESGEESKGENTAVSYRYPEYKTPGKPISGIAGWKTGSVTNYKTVKSDTTTLESGWYVVKGNVITKALAVKGTVHLILMDKAKLECSPLTVNENDSLTIYAQSTDSAKGILEAEGTDLGAGIGGSDKHGCGSITINGGKVKGTAGHGKLTGAGIGGGYGGSGKNITINGGDITVWGINKSAGIGGSYCCEGSNIIINGGKINALGGDGGGAGIGGGDDGKGCDVTINGGEIIAEGGGTGGAGIGGGKGAVGEKISINGGTVSATGGIGLDQTYITDPRYYGGAGIGGGYTSHGDSIYIYGGTITATGGMTAAGIGGGTKGNGSNIIIGVPSGSNDSLRVTAVSPTVDKKFGGQGGAGIGGGFNGKGENITIYSGTVEARGFHEGAGIGGSLAQDGVKISLIGGIIKAYGGSCGAGIGGGHCGDALTITVGDAKIAGNVSVTAVGGSDGGAGIGGGKMNEVSVGGGAKDITVYYGTVDARGGKNAAGIGGGAGIKTSFDVLAAGGNGENITIAGGNVTARGGSGDGGAGIGGGLSGYGKNITVSGGKVEAYGGGDYRGGAGIGAGYNGSAENITVSGGTVKATAKHFSAGIGGSSGKDAYNITITGGTVEAVGGKGGAGIGAGCAAENTKTLRYEGGNAYNITISGGIVIAHGKSGGAGIGGGQAGIGDNIKIGNPNGSGNNLSVTAICEDESGAGIGGGQARYSDGENIRSGGDGKNIYIYNGTVKATGGSGWNNHDGGAGIGGGYDGAGTNINIYGGDVTATGRADGAGIGGSFNRNGEKITISGGTVRAYGGANGGAGIGGGRSGNGADIIIGDPKGSGDNVDVTARGGANGAAGIGGGIRVDDKTRGGNGERITIYNGTVNATGGNNGAGIGGGYYGCADYITIYGGKVTARGKGWAAGIGGCIKNGTNITITGGTIEAYGGSNGGAGIGGGEGGNGEYITIGDLKKGGKNLCVIAEGGYVGGAGIGGGKHSPDNGGGGGRYIYINCGTVKATAGALGGSGIGCGKDDAMCHDIFFNSDLAVRAGKDHYNVKVMSHTTDQDIAKPIHALRYVEALSNEWEYIVTTTNTKDDTIEATRASGTAGISDTKVTVYYDENAKSAKLTSATLVGKPVPKIKYVGVSPTVYAESEAVPTAPGKYKASVTVENATAYVTFIIFEPKAYLDPTYKVPNDPTSGVAGWNIREVEKYSLIDADSETLHGSAYDGWYVVKGIVTADTLKVTGNVKLLLADYSKLTCNTITVNGKNSLSVYAQSEGDSAGELVVLGKEHCAGIGTGSLDLGMRITFNGGKVTAHGSDGLPGIGGFNITINAGTVNANGGFNAAGIGGAVGGSARNITVNGGTVNANGGEKGAGIGGGSEGRGSNIVFNGGKVTSVGGRLGAGIGGGYMARGTDISINGGNIIAYAGESASGIGGGSRFSGKNIHVGTNVALIAGDSAQTAETVTHKTRQDLASVLHRQRYVEAGKPVVWAYSVITTNTTDDTIIATSQSGSSGYTDTRLTIYFDNASLNAKLSSDTFVGKPTPAIKYVGVAPTEYAESETAPTLPGKYEASVTVENAKAHVFFSLGGAASITSGGVTTNYSTIQAAVNAAKANETVVVLSDAQENIVTRRDLTLDLNGFVLTGTGSGSVIRVNGGTLTVKDSDPKKDNEVGATSISGAVITGGTNGGVYIQYGSLVMYGGNIFGNSAKRSGGGVYVSYGSSFTMDGGMVVDNNCVGVYNRGSFYMSGDAGIMHNAGGVYQNGSMYISGSVRITNNRSGDKAVNLCLVNKLVNIEKAGLSVAARIGVTIGSGSGVGYVTERNSKDYSMYFTSDNSRLHVVNSFDNRVMLSSANS